MRFQSALLAGLLLTSCATATGSPPAGQVASAPRSSPSAAPPVSPAVATIGPAICSGKVPTGGNLVLAELAASPGPIVLRDITDTAQPRTVCTFSPGVQPKFATASSVAYLEGPAGGGPADLVRLDLAGSQVTHLASLAREGFAVGRFDFSPDGSAFTYLTSTSTGIAWHLGGAGQDRVVALLPPVPGRGVSRTEDDFMLRFSPDGRFMALVETFTLPGAGPDAAHVQIRRASDGMLVFSTAVGTMGVWASSPSRLFFRNDAGAISRWDSELGLTRLQPALRWVRPSASPDGRWIGYTVYENDRPHVALYSVQADQARPLGGANLRSGLLFLNNNLVWYREEVLCGPTEDCAMAPAHPTGSAFLYDIAGGEESRSALRLVLDSWPRLSTGHGM